MRNLTPGERSHQRIWDLLPWYANGSLAERERELVEGHLAECPRCRDEEQSCRRTAAAVQALGDPAPSPHPVQLQRVLARIAESESSAGGWRPRAAPFRAWIAATPRAARWALAAQAAAILVLAGGLLLGLERSGPAAPPAAYHVLADPAPAPAARLAVRVMFAPESTEREIRQLLHGVRGQLVAGPSPLGVYTLEVPADGNPLKVVLARLRAEPQVAFAEPAAGSDARSEAP